MMKNKKKLRRKKASIGRGAIGSGMMFVMILVLIAGAIGYTLIGGQLPQLDNNKIGNTVVVVTPSAKTAQKNLQLYTFLGLTITPTIPPGNTTGCSKSDFNTEDEILVGSDPAPGTSTSSKIRVWVTDEAPNRIAPNEVVSPSTGEITTIGDRNAKDTDTDGEGNYLWEPTIYVAPAIGAPPTKPFCNAKMGSCTPYFPNIIKGEYNSDPEKSSSKTKGPAIDADWINFKNGPGAGDLLEHSSEYIWDVTTFGLAPGTYWAQFVIHDGDDNLGISCITIQI